MSRSERNTATLWRLILALPTVAAVLILGANYSRSADLYSWINQAGRQRWFSEKVAASIERGDASEAEHWIGRWAENARSLHRSDPHCGVCAGLETLRERMLAIGDSREADTDRAKRAREIGNEMDALIDRVEAVARATQTGLRFAIALSCQIGFTIAAVAHARLCRCDP